MTDSEDEETNAPGSVTDSTAIPSDPDETTASVECDFCHYRCTTEPVTASIEGEAYTFCTEACRTEMERTETDFTQYRGFRRIRPGVAGLNNSLPEGMPRNAFVLIAGETGTREDALGAELMWRTLERDEPAVLVSFTEPPISVVQRFLDLGWNVLPALESDQLRIVDCFTSRIDDSDRFRRRLNRWNKHLRSISEPQTTVADPTYQAEIRTKIDNAIDDLNMVDCGAVYIDSLTEFGSLSQPVRAYDFVKDLRAEVCKGRFVPVFAGATIIGNGEEFPHDLSYMLDGIVELALTGSVVEDTLIRRLRVRKMTGVLAITEWKAYEFTRNRGLVTFDPLEEMANASSTDTE